MRFAFCLNYYFPYGGLQRDFLYIAERVRDRGHEIDVYVMDWQGDFPSGIKVHLLPVKGLTNHGRCIDYINQLMPILERKRFDLVIGFNKMPGLDVYYAADPCFKAKHQDGFMLKRWMPRYQHYLQLEEMVFSPEKKTQILTISEQEKQNYQDCYQTESKRFHALPPPLHPSRKPTAQSRQRALEIRECFSEGKKHVLLIVASAFHTKGVDRVIKALASLPADELKTLDLWVIGQDSSQAMCKLAKKHKVDHVVKFLGAQEEMAAVYAAADLMVHPARTENTGTVLLEALLVGCPVITTANCGYAHYIQSAQAGIVLKDPFSQYELNQTLLNTLLHAKEDLKQWSDSALEYVKTADFFSMPDKALEVIENVAKAA